ncbi:MAG TPA: TonB-dependent receptor [Candidatus Solibacter sp.]|nr:TonB-dependent receptor [Candidatus Solibacter sp.]
MPLRLAGLLLLAATTLHAAEIRGRVTNALGGEALGRVEVTVFESKSAAVTSASGEFSIPNLSPGNYTLRLNAVGYRLFTVPFTLAAATDIKEFSVTLVPDNFHHTDKVEVHGDVFQADDSPATVESNLTASEIRETATVFADDPFRAVQTLPGVSAEGNNEFFAEFSVMGAPFSNVSTYIDDVLVQNPFHEIGNFSEGASLGVLTSEVVEEMKLFPAAYPEKYGDATGAALAVHTREGSRAKPIFRISAGIVASEILGEGALGHNRKGSWLVSARKSYINYLIRGRVQDAADVGYEDGDLKLAYDLTPRQSVSLFATDGHTNMAVSDPASLVPYQYASGNSDFTFARAGWRWSPSTRFLLETRAAYLREPDKLFDNTGILVTKTDHREWNGGVGLSWGWAADQVLQAGWTQRDPRDSEYQGYTNSANQQTAVVFVGSARYESAYVQQSSALLHGRAHLLGSLRWDRFQSYFPQRFSPQASIDVRLARAMNLQFSAGRYTQAFAAPYGFPSGFCPTASALPPTSDHYAAALEQRLGENTRIRLEAFQRRDFSRFGLAPSVAPGDSCPTVAPFAGSTLSRDYSHGVQLTVQRRSANRLSGWLGYTLVKAQQHQYQVPVPYPPYAIYFDSGGYYPTLEDQRHNLNAFAMYRLRPSINVSGKFLFGSGFPVPSGAFIQIANGQFVPVGLNSTRLGTYVRVDARIDKDWAFQRWKMTLYGEVLNLTNHYNSRFAYESGIDPNTGQAQVKTLQGLPVTPTAGLVFQF